MHKIFNFENFKYIPQEHKESSELHTLLIGYEQKVIELKECIITVSQEPKILQTPIQGRDGTIKEFIATDDYKISLDVAVSSYEKGGEQRFFYPINELKSLEYFLSIKEPLALQTYILRVFGIYSGVVSAYSLQQETHSNRQSLRIELISDDPYIIRQKKEPKTI